MSQETCLRRRLQKPRGGFAGAFAERRLTKRNLERRLGEVRRKTLPRTPVNGERDGLESLMEAILRAYPARCSSGRTIITGQWAWRTTESETLPISARLTPPRPLLPMTMSPAPTSSARWMMA